MPAVPAASSCAECGTRSPLTSATLRICGACARGASPPTLARADAVHRATRRAFHLPEAPPATDTGVRCPLCARGCQIGAGQHGFCGLRTVRDGRLVHLAGTVRRGLLQWYRDPLPTNCVADWVCAGSHQRGRHNLAVFYAACTLNCLFCQNWHFRTASATGDAGVSAAELAGAANAQTYCVCFFGGDPAAQMAHALAAARPLARRGVVVCWETAGTSNARLLDRAVGLSLESGGCIKFDLKAFDDRLHRVLTGASNARTLENFERAARRARARRDRPLVVASTLLVPGYVDAAEVAQIAGFIARIDPSIPYALLAFAPQFHMQDLPATSRRHAEDALRAARSAGLTNARVGNRHLLSDAY